MRASQVFDPCPLHARLPDAVQSTDDSSTSMLDVARTVASFLQAFFAAPTYASLRGRKVFLAGESFAGEWHRGGRASEWVSGE